MSWPEACVTIAILFVVAVGIVCALVLLEGEAIIRAWRDKP